MKFNFKKLDHDFETGSKKYLDKYLYERHFSRNNKLKFQLFFPLKL